MKAIICIKIGENEPSTYAKYDKLYKHLDIVDVIPVKYDEKGNIRGMGVKGDKEFWGIVADFGNITNEEFGVIRAYLCKVDFTEIVDGDGLVYKQINKRRFHKIDINDILKTSIGLTKDKETSISTAADSKASKNEVDVSHLNDYSKTYDFIDLAKSILHKDSLDYVYTKIGLDKSSLKTVLSTAVSTKEQLGVSSNINNK